MKLSHLREAPPRHGGNVCMRGKTSHPSYLQFTPDRGNPGNSPVVHACKTHKSTMSTNCPPGHALACMESNRAKAFGLASSAKAQTFKCFVMSIMHTDASKDLSQLALEEEEEMSGLSVSLCAGWFVCEQQEKLDCVRATRECPQKCSKMYICVLRQPQPGAVCNSANAF